MPKSRPVAPVSSENVSTRTSTCGATAEAGCPAVRDCRRPTPSQVIAAPEPAQSREHDAFRQHLADQAAAGGAERGPDRHFLLAMAVARQQQVGHVRARNEQDQADGAGKDVRGRGFSAPPELGSGRTDAPVCLNPGYCAASCF